MGTAAKGALVKVDSVLVAETKSISGMGVSVEMLDATHFTSTVKEKVAGIKEIKPITFTFNLTTANLAALSAEVGVSGEWEFTLQNDSADVATVTAVLSDLDLGGDVGGINEGSATITPTSDITWS